MELARVHISVPRKDSWLDTRYRRAGNVSDQIGKVSGGCGDNVSSTTSSSDTTATITNPTTTITINVTTASCGRALQPQVAEEAARWVVSVPDYRAGKRKGEKGGGDVSKNEGEGLVEVVVVVGSGGGDAISISKPKTKYTKNFSNFGCVHEHLQRRATVKHIPHDQMALLYEIRYSISLVLTSGGEKII
ncbi:hypothetical protein E2C01_027748 [Portunus trituberculatus]|uniref:Uncharacterized protein n=1 Tax=Portunus trituberculatus TaxID=210409 RepID=A0A5B7EJH7_PORTR|nr:hypothetical protein [Portunus trituberculatus]